MLTTTRATLDRVLAGSLPSDDEALALADETDLEPLLAAASELRDRAHRNLISYSRKVFIPLTQLCRDACHYCTFAKPPKPGQRAYMTPDEVLEIARAGAAAGCREALFTLGDKPELRYRTARRELDEMGYRTTIAYLAAMAELVYRETGLLPHANPGVMTAEEIALLRRVSVSQGIMLESAAERLFTEKGAVHYGSPDKRPSVRLATIAEAGRQQVPFTSGILIGIGETRRERIESLLALRRLHAEYGHLQEVIVQNFRAKPGTKMADAPEPDLDDLLWSLAVARIIFGPEMNIQAPPNLSYDDYPRLVAAGLNDWGGVSPVTPDHVNPEAPWPHLEQLRRRTAECGKVLIERLPVYPAYALDSERWQDPALRTAVIRAIDAEGFARMDDWSPGDAAAAPPPADIPRKLDPARRIDTSTAEVRAILAAREAGEDLTEAQIERLFHARGDDYHLVCEAADRLRAAVNGDVVSYVVNRNINYTNICYFRCQFCAFAKGKLSESLRGTPYDLDTGEIVRRAREAWERGATEVCMQGGIHPEYTGATYLRILQAVKQAVPGLHIHAFSPLEVAQGAETLGITVREFLLRLREAGLGTLPGTAAEVLDDEVRVTLCPDKLSTDQWLRVVEEAHRVGFRTTSTIMYGHIDHPRNWARHLVALRDLQKRTGGITEFVPLPFVHMEAPIYLKGRARRGPTFREAVLMHAVARLALHPYITNIQVSWVKMGPEGVRACLDAGVNDMGGTLMNESISRAAGAGFGQELPPEEMERLIRAMGRTPRQRTTTYGPAPEERVIASFDAPPLAPIVLTPVRKYERAPERAAAAP
ncbi:5-amino-6-(D-ribitylamino)uracil--L-tyrosine 4-hydroxyphenyl transferase CofH [Tepidiforma sp.]|uniref:5-amino-6-(D-ribitylamino)uracil--L-tyrosine 4-hydroxyphenyl transferase CofH n=1 Tax=Tepidiforma sp. TaxID=2682230 RepID=UPI00260D5A97|nr:5-amino-6-(D-ribitylamino)uracil--L-tyrosine 4-hydroxyphenyl transferase CofH [Tepidiforma sp.]MCX7616814.1 5-amino-6-(D-ribitylamino)uracil--L-tyrosine 4-hydroxyphenyl transferase CofH [Tepidiforma sp.]